MLSIAWPWLLILLPLPLLLRRQQTALVDGGRLQLP
ncbi:MAG: IMP dehydrogenase, partial [Shewanella sp.]